MEQVSSHGLTVPASVHVCVFSLVSSFFLEKNMLSFFLKIMKQKFGRFVCVQLLQTLNILFENMRNETSLCKTACQHVLVHVATT